MAERESRIGCPLCEGLRARIAELEAQLAKAQKHSGNSSKPPSSDIVKPAPNNVPLPKGQKRRRGGQPGHPRHERPAFTPDQLTAPPPRIHPRSLSRLRRYSQAGGRCAPP